jgi:DNA (cytosine-5)-methyltransferase 1
MLELCAGTGMLGLGVEVALPGARTVCYVEREAYAAAILASRMEAAELASAPVWSDLATFDAGRWRGAVDCVLSGDPCQPNSVAGKRLGADDDRFLIEQVVRIYADSGARRLFRENVTGNAAGQLAAIVPLLAELGCSVAAGIFRAKDVGASHGRERLFIMADRDGTRWTETGSGYSFDTGREPEQGGGDMGYASIARPFCAALTGIHRREESGRPRDAEPERRSSELANPDQHEFRGQSPAGELRQIRASECGSDLADANCTRLPPARAYEDGRGVIWDERPSTAARGEELLFAPGPSDPRWPAIIRDAPGLEPAVCRVADGLANRVDRLRACGNGVVPLVAAYAWRTLEAALDEAAAGAIAVTESAAA